MNEHLNVEYKDDMTNIGWKSGKQQSFVYLYWEYQSLVFDVCA